VYVGTAAWPFGFSLFESISVRERVVGMRRSGVSVAVVTDGKRPPVEAAAMIILMYVLGLKDEGGGKPL
jgi:hypothetical protein